MVFSSEFVEVRNLNYLLAVLNWTIA